MAESGAESAPDQDAIVRVFRDSSSQVIATLARRFGDLDVAEEAVQDAFLAATEHWPTTGVPPNPGGWIMTTARNRAIDRVRRESSRLQRSVAAQILVDTNDATTDSGLDIDIDVGVVRDDRLRLVFTCCHPALAPVAQTALTLRLLGGLQVDEIARAFFVPEATMAQRLVRAKRKIRDANIPFRVPEADDLTERLDTVLGVLYLIFNEGHTATHGPNLARDDLTAEAIRLARLVHELLPDEPEVTGLLALMLLVQSRREARIDSSGLLIRLADQDRTLWDRALIRDGHALVRECLRRNQPGAYQIQAAINAVHADAMTAANTAWDQIVQLYDQLLTIHHTPIVELNRAIAVAELDGANVALGLIADLPLDDYHLYHATRAELFTRLDQCDAAIVEFTRAIELTDNEAERAFLRSRISALSTQTNP